MGSVGVLSVWCGVCGWQVSRVYECGGGDGGCCCGGGGCGCLVVVVVEGSVFSLCYLYVVNVIWSYLL